MDNGGVEEVRILRAAGPAEPVGQVGQLPHHTLKELLKLSPNRYESDLLNEVLYALVGQKAAKISKVKVGG